MSPTVHVSSFVALMNILTLCFIFFCDSGDGWKWWWYMWIFGSIAHAWWGLHLFKPQELPRVQAVVRVHIQTFRLNGFLEEDSGSGTMHANGQRYHLCCPETRPSNLTYCRSLTIRKGTSICPASVVLWFKRTWDPIAHICHILRWTVIRSAIMRNGVR